MTRENCYEVYRSRIAGLSSFKEAVDRIGLEEKRAASDLERLVKRRRNRREECEIEIERLTQDFKEKIESLLEELRQLVVDRSESVSRALRENLTSLERKVFENFSRAAAASNDETPFDKAFRELTGAYARGGAGSGVASKNVAAADEVERLIADVDEAIDKFRTEREQAIKAWRFSDYVARRELETLRESEGSQRSFRNKFVGGVLKRYCEETRRFEEQTLAALTSLPLTPEEEERFLKLANDSAYREEASTRHKAVKGEIAEICAGAASPFADIPVARVRRRYDDGVVEFEFEEPIELSKDAFYFIERVKGDDDANGKFLQNFLFQTLRNEPLGGVDVLIADPNANWPSGFTSSFENARNLSFKIEYIDDRRTFENKLNELTQAARQTTRSLNGETLRKRNVKNPEFAQKYALLFVNNLPRLFEGGGLSNAVGQLCDLAELARDAGVTVVCCGGASVWQEFEKVESERNHAGVAKIKRLRIAPLSLESIAQTDERFSAAGEPTLVEVSAEEIMRLTTFIKAASECRNDAISFDQVIERARIERFGLLSVKEAKAPIGLNASGVPVDWVADNEGRGMTLIVGQTGSGKTNLMHGLITALAHNYFPEELELYLIDLKNGVDFSRYATERLPHAKMVVIQGDPEVAVGALRGIVRRMDERAERLRREGDGANSLTAFRERNEEQKMPRVVVIIDEFTRIFAELENSEEAKKLIANQIIKLGRSYGFHIVLATQDLGRGTPREIVTNATTLIAMQCSENALGDCFGSSDIARDAKNVWRNLRQKGEAVILDSNGFSRFRAPLIKDKEQSERYLRPILEEAEESGYDANPLVYDGQKFPAPSGRHFDDALAQCRDVAAEPDNWKVLCGESEILGENVYWKLERARRQHAFLVVGDLEDETPCRDAIYSVWSRSLNYCRQNGAEFEIRLYDPKNVWAPFLDKEDLTVVSETPELGALLFDVYREVARWKEARDQTAKRILLILTQTEGLKDELATIKPPAQTVRNEADAVPRPNDPFAARFGTRREAFQPAPRQPAPRQVDATAQPTDAQAALKYILEEGAEYGVGAIVSCGDAEDAMQAVGFSRRGKPSEHFAHIVSMRTSEEQNSIVCFGSAKTASRGVGNNRRVVYRCGGETKTFRPYYEAPETRR